MTIRATAAHRTARLTQTNTRIGASAYIRFYSGAQPATADTAASGTLLAESRGNASGFGAVSGDTLTGNAVAQVNAVGAGNAGWFRVLRSDGTTAEYDGSCSLAGGGGDAILPNLNVAVGQPFNVTSITLTETP